MISAKKTLIAAIILLGLLFFIDYQKKNSENNENTEKDYVFASTTNLIDSLKIEFLTGETLSFEKKDNQWFIIDPAKIEADNQTLESLCKSLKELEYSKKVRIQKGSPDDFGFEFPQLKIQFSEGTEENQLSFGDRTFNGTDVFASSTDTHEVYVVNGNLIGRFQKEVRDYKNRDFIILAEENIQEFIFIDDSDEIRLTGKKGTSEIEYNLEIRGEKKEFQSERAAEILDFIKNIRVSEWKALGVTDFSEYGLDDPTYTCKIKTDKNENISFSIGVKGNSYYAVKTGDDDIASIPSYFEYSINNIEAEESEKK